MKKRLPKEFIIQLGAITGFNFLVLFIRNLVLANNEYNFLIWNLFLGFTPLLIAIILFELKVKKINVFFVSGSILWLLFYPNAPYMISDLIHVDKTSSLVVYDALIIFSFAMLSVFYGFYSLKIMHQLYTRLIGTKVANGLVTLSILLSSFGIYLGRVLRLNSWDLFTNPLSVIEKIVSHLFPIGNNPATYVTIILFSSIQFILLIMTKNIDEMQEKQLINGLPAK
ncbi:DUF1361 domain-containing protein [Spirosoma pulveris]